MKLALLVCKDVVTESRRGKSHIATGWHLASRHRAPWKWIPPPGLAAERGTAVRLHLSDALSPLTDEGFIETAIRRHYLPLLDPACDDILVALYPRGIAFELNGRTLEKQACRAPETGPLTIRTGRKRKPSAAGYLYRDSAALPEDERGVAVSTYGKIIKRGWDWIGIAPHSAERIGGVIEVPPLAASLTLNKGDFIRTGTRGAAYLAYRKAIQEAVQRQLAAWGDAREPIDPGRSRAVRALERDLERVLVDLAEGFPLLAALVDQRRGGQKRLSLVPQAETGEGLSGGTATPYGALQPEGNDVPRDDSAGEAPASPYTNDPQPPIEPLEESRNGLSALPDVRAPKRPIRLGLTVQFEERPGDPELGRLVESTVLVNRSHPAYQRAASSRSEGYHVALSVALALAPLAVEPAGEHAFVTTFLVRWGDAVSRTSAHRRR
jgi:hypothetical protein